MANQIIRILTVFLLLAPTLTSAQDLKFRLGIGSSVGVVPIRFSGPAIEEFIGSQSIRTSDVFIFAGKLSYHVSGDLQIYQGAVTTGVRLSFAVGLQRALNGNPSIELNGLFGEINPMAYLSVPSVTDKIRILAGFQKTFMTTGYTVPLIELEANISENHVLALGTSVGTYKYYVRYNREDLEPIISFRDIRFRYTVFF